MSSDILDEVDKCVLLCGECHTILHGQNITRAVTYFTTIQGKTCTQTMQGQCIYDAQKKSMTFLTNERPNIFPVWLLFKRKGKPEEPKKLTVFREIEKRFVSLNKKLRIGDAWGVRSIHGKLVADITRIDATHCRLSQLISFPLIKGEFDDNNGNIALWIRQGIAVNPNGKVSTKGIITIDLIT